MTGLADIQDGPAVEPVSDVVRTRRRKPRILVELETELRRLYLRLMDEPVPARLSDVLRTHSPSKP